MPAAPNTGFRRLPGHDPAISAPTGGNSSPEGVTGARPGVDALDVRSAWSIDLPVGKSQEFQVVGYMDYLFARTAELNRVG